MSQQSGPTGTGGSERIDETLDAVTLLLIITPGLFRSPACRAEVARFLERERALSRQDLRHREPPTSTRRSTVEHEARRVWALARLLDRVMGSRG
jgi:hypothetical protein